MHRIPRTEFETGRVTTRGHSILYTQVLNFDIDKWERFVNGLMRFDAHWLDAGGEGPSSTCRVLPGVDVPILVQSINQSTNWQVRVRRPPTFC